MSAVGLETDIKAVFREVMAGVCSPVAVVTAADGSRPHGSTVSAFTSLSLHPPMVVVALDRTSRLLALIRDTGRFGVNVLGSGQSALARDFARRDGDRFAAAPWRLEDGLPRLEGTTGWLACRAAELVPGGDHVLLLGEVTRAQPAHGSPLTYFRRTFGTHAPDQAH
jgi:flavin reductase (DIM6/NTAB) family NADH-FMN oxidoreductase RutF